jgi:hypothetical protein
LAKSRTEDFSAKLKLDNYFYNLIIEYKHIKRTNLTPSQVKTLNELKTNKGITIKPTDKNLGPAVLDTSQSEGTSSNSSLQAIVSNGGNKDK